MRIGSLNSPAKRNLASLVLGCLVLAASELAARAQAAGYPCEPDPELRQALRGLPPDDARLNARQLVERRREFLNSLRATRPDDVFLHRLAQESASGLRLEQDRSALMKEYRLRLDPRPQSPVYLYLYGRLLIGRNTGEGIKYLQRAIERAPDFPWAHLGLVEAYQVRANRDEEKAAAHLKTFLGLCPMSLEPFKYLRQVNDPELLRSGARRLRALLMKPTGPDALAHFKTLWELEFRITPATEHPRLRRQVVEDLKEMRRQGSAGGMNLFLALGEGYKIVDDREGARWADDQILEHFPYSNWAMSILIRRWGEEHPRPADSREQREAYNLAQWGATEEWLRRWPDHPSIWSRRFIQVFNRRDTPIAQAEAVIDGCLRAFEKYPEWVNGDELLNMAWIYNERNFRRERIPELVLRAFREDEFRYRLNMQNDSLAPETQRGLERSLSVSHWKGWGFLVNYYFGTKEFDKVRDVLTKAAVQLSADDPGESAPDQERLRYSGNQVTYWSWMAQLAEAEGRKLDAVAYHLKVFEARPARPGESSPQAADGALVKAAQLWRELGGSDQAWQAMVSRAAAGKPAIAASLPFDWEHHKLPLPDFELPDLQGRKWRLADLKGKVSFINLWATWCGPCHAELPEIQKLYERLKGQPGTLVLTLNLDRDVGLVEPFLKQNGYSFPVIPASAFLENLLPALSLPTSWIVGPDGAVRMRQLGFMLGDTQWLDRAVEEIQRARGAK